MNPLPNLKQLPTTPSASEIVLRQERSPYILLKCLFAIALLCVSSWGIYTFSEKDFSAKVYVNNTITIPERNTTINIPIENKIDPKLNFTINIPVEIVNATNGN